MLMRLSLFVGFASVNQRAGPWAVSDLRSRPRVAAVQLERLHGEAKAVELGHGGILVLDVDGYVRVDLGQRSHKLGPAVDVVADTDSHETPGDVLGPGVAPGPVSGGDLVRVAGRYPGEPVVQHPAQFHAVEHLDVLA